MAMMGSAVWAGRLPLEPRTRLTDRAGMSVRERTERARHRHRRPLQRQPVKASFEVHIEQGPVLEQNAKTIGVVTGVQHMSRHEIVVKGQEAHAGPDPHGHAPRSDPRAGGSAAGALRRDRAARPAMRASRSASSRPARVRRTPCPGSCASPWISAIPMRSSTRSCAATSTAASGRARGARPERRVRCVWEAPGVSFDSACVAAVRGAAGALGFDAMDMVSGAGHDSCNVSAVVPTAMVFVPCAGGLATTRRRARRRRIWRRARMCCCTRCSRGRKGGINQNVQAGALARQ